MEEKPFEPVGGYAIQLLNPDTVTIQRRLRKDMGDIDDLAESIKSEGQIEPIEVLEMPDGSHELEDGERRLRACRKLNILVRAEVIKIAKPQDTIRFQFHKLMREIHATTKRKGFDVLEEAEALRRSKDLYERAYPQSKQGAQTKDAPKVPRFTAVASESLNVSKTKVYDLLAVAALPAKRKAEIEKAPAGERNRMLQQVMRQARDEKKMQGLQERADAGRQGDIIDPPKDRVPAVVHEGDCRDFMKGKDLYQVILTDPPYERGRKQITHTDRKTINPEDYTWDKLDTGWVIQAAPLLVKGGTLLAFCPVEYIGDYEIAFEAAGLEYRQALFWHKTNPAPTHRPVYPYGIEAIVWAVKPGGTPHFDRKVASVGASNSNLYAGPGLPGSAKDRVHPTQKPDWLITALLKVHAPPQAHVFDPFCGSGTTGVCARKLGMPSTLVDADPQWVKATTLRLDAV